MENSGELSSRKLDEPPGRLGYAFAVLRHFWSSPVSRAAIDRLAPKVGEQVVDLGAGLGPATLAVARRVGATGSVTAVDPSLLMQAALRVRRLWPGRRRIRVRSGVAESLPLADDAVDAAIGMNVAHLLTDVQEAASELRRVLKVGGRVLFVEEDIDDPSHSFHPSGGDESHGHGPHNVDGPELGELVSALRDVGFAVAVEQREIGGQPTNTVFGS